MSKLRNMKSLSGAAVAAALSLSAAAGAADTIKIGGMAPLSSPGSYQQGPELVLGLQWAVDDVNAAGGLLGRQVELIVEDTQGRPPTGATVAEKLITKDKVVAAAGEYHSSVCTAEIEVFHQHGIPFVIGSCWADKLTAAGYDEIFRTSVYSSKLAENMVAVMMANGIRNAAGLVEDTDYGVGVAENLEGAIKKLNADIEFSYEVVEKTSKDFVPILLKYKTQVKPEILIVAVTQPGGFLILKQAPRDPLRADHGNALSRRHLHPTERQGVLGCGEGRGQLRDDVPAPTARASSSPSSARRSSSVTSTSSTASRTTCRCKGTMRCSRC